MIVSPPRSDEARSIARGADVLAFMSESHRVQIRSTNPLERLNAEIKRSSLTRQMFGVTNLVADRNRFGYNYP